MPNEFGRNKRLAALIKTIIGKLLQHQVVFEWEGLVTLTAVDLSPDLNNAKLYYIYLSSASLQADKHEEVTTKLNEQVGVFRHHLAKQLTSKRVPKLHFYYDKSIAQAEHLNSLIEQAHNKSSAFPSY